MLVSINLDGTGVCTSNSKIPFLDHMMDVRPLSASALCSLVFAGTWSPCAYHIVYSVLQHFLGRSNWRRTACLT